MNSYSFGSRPVRYVRWTPNCSGGLSSRHEQVSKRDSCFQTYLLPGDNRPLTTPIGIIVRLPQRERVHASLIGGAYSNFESQSQLANKAS